MKIKKTINKYCPKCKKYTPHKVVQAKKKSKGSTHPLSRGSKTRTRKRGEWRGYGNLGRYSKPPKPKMTGKKLTKKTDLRYVCEECGYTLTQKKGIRTKKLEII